MAWVDQRLEFSDAQALTATAASTNAIDVFGPATAGASGLTVTDRDIGPGKTVWVCLSLDVGADDGSANETYVVDLETDDNDSFSSATTIGTFTITRGDAAGTKYVLAVPYDNERYLRLNYTLGGTTPTVTVSSWLTDQEPTSWKAYQDNVN